MKRLAMNFDPSPVKGLPSFLQMMKSGGGGSKNMLQRWWLEPNYQSLLVSPDDAQKLALASQEGRIQLALRNPLDTKKDTIAATRASSLYIGEKTETAEKPKAHKVTAKASAPAPPAPYQVEMIRGNKRDETKFEDK